MGYLSNWSSKPGKLSSGESSGLPGGGAQMPEQTTQLSERGAFQDEEKHSRGKP